MKKKIAIALSTTAILTAVSTAVEAGTFMLGAKTWYAQWASATDKAVADVLVSELGTGWSAKVNPGTGFMAGPVIGYQTDDRTWSFSFAYMFINRFSQKTDWTQNTTTVGTKTTMSRNDIDLSISFLLVDRLKIYVGYKYTSAKYDVKFDDGTDFYKIDYVGNIPTAGIAVAFPLTERISIGAQAGILYVIPNYKWDSEKLKTDKALGYSIEPNISFLPIDSFIIQLGMRYQIYNVKFTDPAFSITKNDEFLGVTLAGIFLI